MTAAALAPSPPARAVLLGASAAGSCPVKTQHAFDPTGPVPAPPVPLVPYDERARFVAQVAELLIAGGAAVDLRLLDDPADQLRGCLRAAAAGAPVILGGRLPADPAGHRVGRPDVLVRGADRPDGRPGYHPVLIRWHKVLRPVLGEEAAPEVRRASLRHPGLDAAESRPGTRFRVGTRSADLLQLAHHRRLLEAAGLAAPAALGAVIGTDDLPGEPSVVWVDLGSPQLRGNTPGVDGTARLRTALECYDEEHAVRVRIAEAAREPDRTTLPVVPVVTAECARCPWWERCRERLDPDDVSLRIDRGQLDRREVETLRRLGTGTVASLAEADLDQLLAAYLPDVGHRAGAEDRLRTAARRARMLRAGEDLVRETSGPIPVASAALEIDLDVESGADGRVYLWGFLVDDGRGCAEYVPFARFADLDDAAEVDLAREAFGWLRERCAGATSVRIYHYSEYEVSRVRALAARAGYVPTGGEPEAGGRTAGDAGPGTSSAAAPGTSSAAPGDSVLEWASELTDTVFCDLLETVKAHFFGVHGLGLKHVARHAGFAWRDADPGGLNSQRWFDQAVHGTDAAERDAARRRVLAYNEDDVAATRWLRRWLRER